MMAGNVARLHAAPVADQFADQRGKHEINGCRQFDPGPVGRLAAPRRA
jgi:hypothetical protein